MRTANHNLIDIDGELFKEDITEGLKKFMNITPSEASRRILRKSDGYLSNSCSKNRIDEAAFETLVTCLSLDPYKYMTHPEEETEEPKSFTTTDIVVGLNSVYNLINQLLTEVKTTNSLLQEALHRETVNREMVKTISSNVTKATDKITAIFTDVHYNIGK